MFFDNAQRTRRPDSPSQKLLLLAQQHRQTLRGEHAGELAGKKRIELLVLTMRTHAFPKWQIADQALYRAIICLDVPCIYCADLPAARKWRHVMTCRFQGIFSNIAAN